MIDLELTLISGPNSLRSFMSLVLLIANCTCLIGCEDENSRALEVLFLGIEDNLCQSLTLSPADGATDQPIDLQLGWSCVNADGDSILYALYFGTSNPPPPLALDLSEEQYEITGLERSRQYFWKIAISDIYGAVQEGPVWNFYTTGNQPPSVPSNPTPVDGAMIRDLRIYLEWDAVDPDGELTNYDVHWGTDSAVWYRGDLDSRATHHQYYIANLNFDQTYYWRIVAEDEFGHVSMGPLWQFSLPYMGQIVYEWGGRQIYRAQADGTVQTQLTQFGNFGAAANPDWSPDYTQIAFDAYLDYQNDTSGIWVMNPDGSGQTRLTQHAGKDEAPSWSPDGSRIVFHRRAPSETATDIWIMNYDGSNQINLTASALLYETGPDWSPDGTRICFAAPSALGSRPDIWVMNTDGSGQTNLTNTDNYWDGLANWSPDGQKIAYGSSRINDYQIVVMNADGSGEVVLTTGTDENHAPAWSPDGTMIAYCSGAPYYDIFLMNADGTGSIRIIDEPPSSSNRSYFVPSWGFPPK